MTRPQERLQLMHIGRQLLQVQLEDIAVRHSLDPIAPAESKSAEEEEESYYLQYPAELRRQAEAMSQYYRIFYCLENSIRDLVESQLEETYGENWWNDHVPEGIKASVESNKLREQDNGVSLRSSHPVERSWGFRRGGRFRGIVGADGFWCVLVTVWCWWAAAPCR